MKASSKIDWLKITSRSLEAQISSCEGCANYLAERLAALWLQRLPREMRLRVLNLLPEEILHEAENLRASVAQIQSDRSIGFTDLVEDAERALGCASSLQWPKQEEEIEVRMSLLSEEVASTFLSSFFQAIPPDLREELIGALPYDLRFHLKDSLLERLKVA